MLSNKRKGCVLAAMVYTLLCSQTNAQTNVQTVPNLLNYAHTKDTHNKGTYVPEPTDYTYKRKAFSSRWLDLDSDCQSTRTEVLIRDSLVDVTLSESGCFVIGGLWIDPYLGKIIRNVKNIDIDHIVPLKEVFDSGGYLWTNQRKREYANDLNVLIVTHKSSNRSKKSKAPSEWMPSNRAYWNTYLSKWEHIKSKYNLMYDDREYSSIRKLKRKARTYIKGDSSPLSCKKRK